MAKPKNKYYAIKKGKEIGIFEEEWDEVSKLIKGFKGASYKGFPTLEEAKQWFYGTSMEVREAQIDKDTLVAYVDGSSSAKLDSYGSGVVFVFPSGEIEKMSFSGNNEEAKSMKNVAGELSASMMAMKVAKGKNFKKLIINHDYEGISKWITGEWRTRKEMTRKYKEWYDKNIKDYIEVSFKWVRGHSGDKYNEMADELAKNSIGIS